MSQLTAHSVLPIISALPDEEKQLLLQELKKMVLPRKNSKPKKPDLFDEPGMEIYKPENREILAAKIMNGDF